MIEQNIKYHYTILQVTDDYVKYIGTTRHIKKPKHNVLGGTDMGFGNYLK